MIINNHLICQIVSALKRSVLNIYLSFKQIPQQTSPFNIPLSNCIIFVINQPPEMDKGISVWIEENIPLGCQVVNEALIYLLICCPFQIQHFYISMLPVLIRQSLSYDCNWDRIAVAKGCSHKVQCHRITLLSEGNSGSLGCHNLTCGSLNEKQRESQVTSVEMPQQNGGGLGQTTRKLGGAWYSVSSGQGMIQVNDITGRPWRQSVGCIHVCKYREISERRCRNCANEGKEGMLCESKERKGDTQVTCELPCQFLH